MKNISNFILIILFLFTSCQDGSKKENEPTEDNKRPQENVITLEDLGELVEPPTDSTASLQEMGIPLEASVLNDSTYVFQGDILIEKGDALQPLEQGQRVNVQQKSAARTKGFWPNNKFYYTVSEYQSDQVKNKIAIAIRNLEEQTNIEFINEIGPDGSYVEFYPSSGCSSYIGKRGGKQSIYVGDGCSAGNIMHEIMHALGFLHEQSRADRDKYVKIHWENIEAGRAHNFRNYLETGSDGQDIGGELDFGSIMMYPSYSFSSNGKPTITKLDGSTYYAQRYGPSEKDLEAINMLYPKQEEVTEPVEPTYVNGELYFRDGIWLLYYRDRWHFSTKYGWKVVVKKGEWWFYV